MCLGGGGFQEKIDGRFSPQQIKVFYWRQKKSIYTVKHGFPALISVVPLEKNGEGHVYGLPSLEYPNHVKICSHYGKEIDPESRDIDNDKKAESQLSRFVGNYIPYAENKPSIIEQCIYTVKRAKVCFWQTKSDKYTQTNGYPCVIVHGIFNQDGDFYHMYGTPALEYPNHIKLCGESHHYLQDPDERDIDVHDVDEKMISTFVKDTLPGIEPKPSIIECGTTTDSPDKHFILDKHPQHSNIVLGAGFSGHGFKMAPVIGRILSKLASNLPLQENLSPFRINRFKDVELTKSKI